MKNLNWTKISALAEIISSLAVLITLIYLATEINQNTLSLQSSARADVMQTDIEWIYKHMEDPELAALVFNRAPKNENESTKLTAYLLTYMRMKEASFIDYQADA